MYMLLIIIHVIASLILIAVILLQAGRGGGLSEMFGGSSTDTIFGTSAADFLKKATSVAAIVFLSTCLILAVYSSKRSKSIMEGVRTMPVQSQGVPVQIPVDKTTKAESPQPAQ